MNNQVEISVEEVQASHCLGFYVAPLLVYFQTTQGHHYLMEVDSSFRSGTYYGLLVKISDDEAACLRLSLNPADTKERTIRFDPFDREGFIGFVSESKLVKLNRLSSSEVQRTLERIQMDRFHESGNLGIRPHR
jgi:hypothetical protein